MTLTDGTFLIVFGEHKSLNILSRYATDKLIMHEVMYHFSTRFSIALHRKKKEHWPTLPM